VIAIGLISLHMVIGAGRCRCGCCIRGSRGGRAEGAGRLGVEFSGKLVDAGEGAAERGEVHHVRIGMIGGVMDSSSRAHLSLGIQGKYCSSFKWDFFLAEYWKRNFN